MQLIKPAAIIVSGAMCLFYVGSLVTETPDNPGWYSEPQQGTTMPPTTDSGIQPLWKQHMNEVKLGMTQSEVKALLGDPDDTSSTEIGDELIPATRMDSWTYGTYDYEGATWSLSFTDGKLDVKSRF